MEIEGERASILLLSITSKLRKITEDKNMGHTHTHREKMKN